MFWVLVRVVCYLVGIMVVACTWWFGGLVRYRFLVWSTCGFRLDFVGVEFGL